MSGRVFCLVCGAQDDEVEKMHYFPKKLEKSMKWQRQMGIKFSGDSLHGYRICSRHFTPECYTNSITYKLGRHALPTLFPCNTSESLKIEAEENCSSGRVSETSAIEQQRLDEVARPGTTKVHAVEQPRTPSHSQIKRGMPESEVISSLCYGKKCAVVNCPNSVFNKQYRYFTFPSNADKCKEWRMLANNPNITKFSDDELRDRYSVCDRHFSQRQFFDGSKGEKLKLLAGQAPTLNLMKTESDALGEQDNENVGVGASNLNTDSETAEKGDEEHTLSLTNSVPTLPIVSNGGMVNMCRICLNATSKSTKLINPQDEQSTCIKKMIIFVLPDINLDLYLYPVICEQCEVSLLEAYKFKSQWLESEKVLSKVIPSSETGNYVIRPVINEKKATGTFSLENFERLKPEESVIVARTDHSYSKSYGLDCDQINEQRKSCQDEQRDDSTNQMQDKHETKQTVEHTQYGKRAKKSCRRLELPDIHNLLDHNYDEYFGRIRKHSDLRKKLRRLKRPDRGEPPYLCEICGQKYNRWAQLDYHMQRHNGATNRIDFVCEICGVTLKKMDIRKHYATHRPRPKPHTCPICQRKFSYVHLLARHVKFKHETEEFAQCHVCGKKMKRSSLRIHLTKHSPSQMTQCHICDKLVSRLVFKAHMNWHQHGRYRCQICDRTTSTKTGLKNHVESYHGKGGDYLCGICGKLFVTKTRLRRHFILIHARSLDAEESTKE